MEAAKAEGRARGTVSVLGARWGRAFSSRLRSPVDPASLAVFRMAFGLLMVTSVVRFVAYGWVDELYLAPQFHFTYLGFDWVKPWPRAWMFVHMALLGLSALSVGIGFLTRCSAAVFCVLFTYVELIDQALYLNHYYFVSLISFLLIWVPSGEIWSLDAWLRRRRARREGGDTVAPRSIELSSLVLLRAQVAIVYFFAGAAKLNSDWLFRAEPLRTWLLARADFPLLGSWFLSPSTAYLMSWAGMVFDLTVWCFLLWKKARPYAVLVALGFHFCVWLLFPIGMFSFVMMFAITIFFEPSWPRELVGRLTRRASHKEEQLSAPPFEPARALPRPWYVFAALFLALQACIPLRFALYPGAVNWTEQGFRFAWRVMLIEKTGQVEFLVKTGSPDKLWLIFPRDELTLLQAKMMSTQADMIQAYALVLRERFERDGYENVRVYADTWVAFNGRRRQRLIDPEVDLASAPRSLAPKTWIVPLREE